MSPFPKALALLSTCLMMASAAHPVQELARQYKNTPHHADISRFVSAMESTGNADVKDKQGCTLLMYCLLELPEMHMASIIHPLLLAGLSPDTPDELTGLTPLHHAARRNDYRLACRLLAFGADRNLRDKQGRTPADLAKLPQLQSLLRTGIPAEIQSPRAAALHTKACGGDAAAQYELAQLYRDEATEDISSMSGWVQEPDTPDTDAAESRCWLEQAAAASYPPALHDLALRLMWGMDGKQDEASAYKLLQQAAAAGYRPSADFLKENPPPAQP
ncbi:MAG: hypothetical protein E7034_01050 [Akkermansiaceae bacterium]|nr:hypothetical protein [Akkermansiaceae bacterium]